MIKWDHAQKVCVKETDGNNVYSMISPYCQLHRYPTFPTSLLLKMRLFY